MAREFAETAARTLRIVAAYDGRSLDEFEIRALELVMAKYPKITEDDYREGIVNYHRQPRSRMKPGHIIEGGKRAFAERTAEKSLTTVSSDTAPKPSNYQQMLEGMSQITRELRAQGIDPTNKDVLREYSRRVKESRNSA